MVKWKFKGEYEPFIQGRSFVPKKEAEKLADLLEEIKNTVILSPNTWKAICLALNPIRGEERIKAIDFRSASNDEDLAKIKRAINQLLKDVEEIKSRNGLEEEE